MRENYYKQKFFSCARNLCIKVKTCTIQGTLMQNDLTMCQYFRLYIKIICGRPLKHILLFEIWAGEICEKLVYKYSETIEYVKT